MLTVQRLRVLIAALALIPAASLQATPPATSGPRVVRSEVEFAVFYVDTDRQISAIHGADILEFCNGTVDFDLVSLQEITNPRDALRLTDLIRGEVRTSVWPFTVFDCGLFTTVTPLATGTARITLTDNDLITFLRPHDNRNAFGFVAQGKLQAADGTARRFNGVSKCVWDGFDDSTLKCVDMINLQ